MVACLCRKRVTMIHKVKGNQKHLTATQRFLIEKGLNNQHTFAELARRLQKDPSTISKEVRRHREIVPRKQNAPAIPCSNRPDCKARYLCSDNCAIYCKICQKPKLRCTDICTDYKPTECMKLNKPPYVCNGCAKKTNCLLQKYFYSGKYADDIYRETLVSSREGINQSAVDIAMLDDLISPLLLKGQSIAHIYSNHAAEIPCCRKTLYNYIDKSVFTARNIDLRRRVRYKPRKKQTRVSLSVREFRMERTYDDFRKLLKEYPDISVVEMDTVEGNKGGKVFLTMLFRNCTLMLIFLMEEKTQDCVRKVFDSLTQALGTQVFQSLFPVILTDNGTEFQNPLQLEYGESGEQRTKIYYCNPHSSWQKGMIEKNHEYIRHVIPKGKSFDRYTQKEINRMMNHINSEARDRLNGCTPYKLSKLLLDNKLHSVLHLQEIAPDEVMLKPELLR